MPTYAWPCSKCKRPIGIVTVTPASKNHRQNRTIKILKITSEYIRTETGATSVLVYCPICKATQSFDGDKVEWDRGQFTWENA